MIIFLHGNNSFERSNRLNILRDAFRAKFDEAGLSVEEISGSNFSIDEFHKHTRSAGLFATKRFVVLSELWDLSKDEQETLLEELDSVDADTILCISADAPPRKDNKLFKRLLNADTVEEFSELDGSALREFIQKQAKAYGTTIDTQATQQLINAIGNDLWRMNNEIHKLANYNPQITAESVNHFADEQLDDNIFHFTDALGAKNAKEATRLLQEQIENGANAQYLLAMLGRHFNTLLKVKQTDGGKGLKMHSFVIEKSRAQGKQFSAKQLLKLNWEIIEMDSKLKSSKHDSNVLLQQFVINACA